jgi:hypothetical protein
MMRYRDLRAAAQLPALPDLAPRRAFEPDRSRLPGLNLLRLKESPGSGLFICVHLCSSVVA